jgi:hypothetical protein
MNRLTKQIALLLISSSSILCGCVENERDEDKDGQPPQAGNPGLRVSHGAHPIFYSGGHSFGGGGGETARLAAPGTSGVVHGVGAGSVRGGFGASAHGAGS